MRLKKHMRRASKWLRCHRTRQAESAGVWEVSGECSHAGVCKEKQQGVTSLQRDPHHQERCGCATDGEHKVSASWSVLSKDQDLRWAWKHRSVIPATRESEVRGLKGQVLTQLQKVQNLKKKLGYIYIPILYIRVCVCIYIMT